MGPRTPDSLDEVAHLEPSLLCRYCRRHLERAVEVITTCEFLWIPRWKAFGVFTLSQTSPRWSPGAILRFLSDPHVAEMERDEPF